MKDYESPRDDRLSLGRYIDFYNHERPHQALACQTPASLFLADKTTISQEKILLTDPLLLSKFLDHLNSN
ncbi:MAG: transposase [Chloroflexi bacterium]|nr:transposase [Chloroflexota bacterium]